jgi:hypothetical protein
VLAVSINSAMIALMIEAASTSETSANFDQTTRHNNPENSHLHIRRRENLNLTLTKSYAEEANPLVTRLLYDAI